ncbi:MAG: NAD(P)/FAD-dependent oxidoreductase [Bdellovibrionales bacterium]|nr:NAD(P)/FAD-dependent oxidoreductase [Bdellovibrionales bacterium]
MMRKIVVIGGGAAGFFGAIWAAEEARKRSVPAEVVILEMSSDVLKKVRISGGGRCNVTHNIFETRPFCAHYPRGERELLSAMDRFQAKDTVEWFSQRGVRLVPEKDGRMFPDTNDSQTVIDCFLRETKRLGIQVLTNHSVQTVERREGGGFVISVKDKAVRSADALMIATGSLPVGYRLAESLGHTITDLAPSLFSFKIVDPVLEELSGLSFEKVEVRLSAEGMKAFKESGPMLITHWGLSGPAILKLSAWAAREMKAVDYKAKLSVNWLGAKRIEDVTALIKSLKEKNVKGQIGNFYPEQLPRRLWLKFLAKARVPEDKRWADISGKEITALTEVLFNCVFEIQGKNRYKDEFVECGGVSLKEIEFRKMESKICPGLFFAGEVLDIDGITGGFNFQAAWTGGAIAGTNMVLG